LEDNFGGHELKIFADKIVETYKNAKKTIICDNESSASDALPFCCCHRDNSQDLKKTERSSL
jgi:phosphoheptose isomerase